MVQGRILASGGSGGGADLVPSGCRDLLLLDVTPLSLGIELEGRAMSTLIKRNTAIPCRKTRTYTTVADYQTDIDVVIYEGERPVRRALVLPPLPRESGRGDCVLRTSRFLTRDKVLDEDEDEKK